MDACELERVRKDVETIKQAAGFGLPFGWDSVWANSVGIPCIGVCCLVYWLISDSPSRYATAVPTVLLLLLLGYLRLRYRRSTGRSATERREYGGQFYATLFLVVVGGGLLTWAQLRGIDIRYIACGLVTCLGMAITLNGLSRMVYRSAVGGGIPCILYGVSIAVWPSPGAVLLNAGMLCLVAGPAMALIQVHQLRSRRIDK